MASAIKIERVRRMTPRELSQALNRAPRRAMLTIFISSRDLSDTDRNREAGAHDAPNVEA